MNESQIAESVDEIILQWPIIDDFCVDVAKKEALLWQMRWISADEKPNTFIDALNLCDENMYPNVFDILKICATIPVTVATTERSFSTLKRIKTYLRNTTSENRLNGLAALSIHREIQITADEVIDKFKQKNRKMLL